MITLKPTLGLSSNAHLDAADQKPYSFSVVAHRSQNPGKTSPGQARGPYQVVLVLEGVVQRGDPLTVPVHQHVAPPGNRPSVSGESELCVLGWCLQGAAPKWTQAPKATALPCSGQRL